MKTLLLITIATFGLTASTMAQNIPNYVPSNGLVGWWPFNGNANDESGNGNNGTVNGATLMQDRFGNIDNAYSFNGINSSITVADNGNLDILNSISISCWFKKNNFNNKYEFLIGKEGAYNGNQCNYKLQFAEIDNNLAFFTNPRGQSGCYNQNNCLTLLNTNDWFHIVGVSRNDSMFFFLNGNLVWNSLTLSDQELVTNEAPLMFGKAPFSDPNQPSDSHLHYDGQIDDIGIWNRALTQQEITDLYNGNPGITGFNFVTLNNTIKIFPNPANNQITIDYGNYAGMNGYQLKIENSLGQKLFQTNITQQTDYLSLNNWGGNGLYFVHIIDPQGNTIDIRKIVLQ